MQGRNHFAVLIVCVSTLFAPRVCIGQNATFTVTFRGPTLRSIQSVDSLPLKEGVVFGRRLSRSWHDRSEIDPISRRHLLELDVDAGFPADSQDVYLYFINPTMQEQRGSLGISRALHGRGAIADDFAALEIILPPGSRLQLKLDANDGHEPYNMTADRTSFWRVFDISDLIGKGVIACRSDTRTQTLRGDLWRQEYRQLAAAPPSYEHVACWPPGLNKDPGLFAVHSTSAGPMQRLPQTVPTQDNPQVIGVDCLCRRGELYNAYWFSQHLGGPPRTDSVVVLSSTSACQYGCNDGTAIVGLFKARVKVTEVNEYMVYKVLIIAEPVP